jgi:hypothetical protein
MPGVIVPGWYRSAMPSVSTFEIRGPPDPSPLAKWTPTGPASEIVMVTGCTGIGGTGSGVGGAATAFRRRPRLNIECFIA